jgi:hypothetical protein
VNPARLAPTFANLGDLTQPIKLRTAHEPLAVLESRLRFLEAARPPNQEVERLRDWILRRDAVRLEIVLARNAGENVDED